MPRYVRPLDRNFMPFLETFDTWWDGANGSSPRKHASKLESILSLDWLVKLGLGWMVKV